MTLINSLFFLNHIFLIHSIYLSLFEEFIEIIYIYIVPGTWKVPSKCKEVVGHKTADFKNYLRGYFEFWHIELYLSTVDILKNGELSKKFFTLEPKVKREGCWRVKFNGPGKRWNHLHIPLFYDFVIESCLLSSICTFPIFYSGWKAAVGPFKPFFLRVT